MYRQTYIKWECQTYSFDDGNIFGCEGGILHLGRLDGEESDCEDEGVQPHVRTWHSTIITIANQLAFLKIIPPIFMNQPQFGFHYLPVTISQFF